MSSIPVSFLRVGTESGADSEGGSHTSTDPLLPCTVLPVATVLWGREQRATWVVWYHGSRGHKLLPYCNRQFLAASKLLRDDECKEQQDRYIYHVLKDWYLYHVINDTFKTRWKWSRVVTSSNKFGIFINMCDRNNKTVMATPVDRCFALDMRTLTPSPTHTQTVSSTALSNCYGRQNWILLPQYLQVFVQSLSCWNCWHQLQYSR
jgi:hypothetical protein